MKLQMLTQMFPNMFTCKFICGGGVFGRTYSDHDYCKSGGGIFAKLWGLGQDDRRNKRHFIVRIHVQYKIFINSAI